MLHHLAVVQIATLNRVNIAGFPVSHAITSMMTPIKYAMVYGMTLGSGRLPLSVPRHFWRAPVHNARGRSQKPHGSPLVMKNASPATDAYLGCVGSRRSAARRWARAALMMNVQSYLALFEPSCVVCRPSARILRKPVAVTRSRVLTRSQITQDEQRKSCLSPK